MLSKMKKGSIFIAIVLVLTTVIVPMSHATASAYSAFPVESVESEDIDLDIVGSDGFSASTSNETGAVRLASAEDAVSLSGSANSISSILGGTDISTVDINDGSALPIPQSLNSGASSRTSSASTDSNDSPGSPIGLALGNYYTQTIGTVGDSRWFATITTATVTKLTTVLAMAANVDFDLYIYKLNGGSLNLVAYSELTGNGVQEVSNYFAAPGTYYFRVVAYAGTGALAIYNFASTAFDEYEVNDSQGASSAIILTSSNEDVSIVGNIDNPLDRDFYVIEFPAETRVAFNLISSSDADYVVTSNNTIIPADMSFVLTAPSGNANDPVSVYVRVLSPTGYSDDTDDYTLEVNQLPYTPGSTLVLESFDHSVIVEAVFLNGVYIEDLYVNGHLFNWNYYWTHSYSNSSAGYNYTVSFSGGGYEDRGFTSTHIYSPSINLDPIWLATYSSNLSGHNKVFTASNPALIMGFANIYAYSTRTAYGSYAGPGANWDDTKIFATVVVDPSNGNIIDMIDPNVLYSELPWEYNFSIGEVTDYGSIFD
jgi:hypothetical protein